MLEVPPQRPRVPEADAEAGAACAACENDDRLGRRRRARRGSTGAPQQNVSRRRPRAAASVMPAPYPARTPWLILMAMACATEWHGPAPCPTPTPCHRRHNRRRNHNLRACAGRNRRPVFPPRRNLPVLWLFACGSASLTTSQPSHASDSEHCGTNPRPSSNGSSRSRHRRTRRALRSLASSCHVSSPQNQVLNGTLDRVVPTSLAQQAMSPVRASATGLRRAQHRLDGRSIP